MTLTKAGYTKRLVDDELSELLTMFGAVSIEGPKYCGKTWTALNHANSSVLLTKSDDPNSDYQRALTNRSLIYTDEPPELIDEWQSIEQVWDDVRTKCDEDGTPGKYILTGSSVPANQEKIFHSGAGRIYKLGMYTMSLFESGDSEGVVSLKDLFDGATADANLAQEPTLELIADLLVRGGWPASLKYVPQNYYRLPASYIEDVLDHDINYDGVKRDKEKMRQLLRSLARNESTLASNEKIVSDIDEYTDEEQYQVSRNTVADYLNVLANIHLIQDQPPFTENVRSSIRVGKSAKRHFVDPSLACAVLGVRQAQLMKDLGLMGCLFEGLALRDLRIYIEHLGGRIYHYRDNGNGEEVDAIVELADGVYGAIEIKLGVGAIDRAASDLVNFANKCQRKPAFLCVVSGLINYAYRRADGVYVVPITALKP
ncbi:ATP-binding protein [Candidatus Saccharibacteria bacterium]|nr:ATP-binding protein [Candidatus Saccharibacteria bacterium]